MTHYNFHGKAPTGNKPKYKPGVAFTPETFIAELERSIGDDTPDADIRGKVANLIDVFRQSVEAAKVPDEDYLDADEREFITALETALTEGKEIARQGNRAFKYSTKMGEVCIYMDITGSRSHVEQVTIDGEAIRMSPDAAADVKGVLRRAAQCHGAHTNSSNKARMCEFTKRMTS